MPNASHPVRVHVRHLGGADHRDHPAGDAAPIHIRRIYPGTTVEFDASAIHPDDEQHYEALQRLVEDGWVEVSQDGAPGRPAPDSGDGVPVDPATPVVTMECPECATTWSGPGNLPKDCPKCGAPGEVVNVDESGAGTEGSGEPGTASDTPDGGQTAPGTTSAPPESTGADAGGAPADGQGAPPAAPATAATAAIKKGAKK